MKKSPVALVFLSFVFASCSSPGQDLFRGARNGDAKLVEHALSRGVSIEICSVGGDTPLTAAAEAGRAEIVRLLLSKGAQVNKPDRDFGFTPLHCAAWRAQLETARLLLEAGADPNATSRNGETPLARAAANPAGLPVVRLLLENGAAIDTSDAGGKTPLSAAAQNGMADIVAFLLMSGANPGIPDIIGQTPLFWAQDTDIVRMLIENNAELRTRNDHGATPLIDAATLEKPDKTMILLAAGAKIDDRDDNGWSALMTAAMHGRLAVIKLLLANGADTTLRSLKGARFTGIADKRDGALAFSDITVPAGRTAKDIARMMGWKEIEAQLSGPVGRD